jgi:hypothetical protein
MQLEFFICIRSIGKGELQEMGKVIPLLPPSISPAHLTNVQSCPNRRKTQINQYTQV